MVASWLCAIVQAQGGTSAPIARIEVEVPQASTFLLQAVLPVREATLPPGGSPRSFALIDSDGEPVIAQVEVVSRFAQTDRGADVIELLAPLHTPTSSQPGDRVTYDVVLVNQPLQPPAPLEEVPAVLFDGTTPLSSPVQGFVSDPDSLVLRTRDAYGNVYERRPLDESSYAEVKKYGEFLTQVRSYDVMKPVEPTSAAGDPFRHFFGIHAYVTVRADTDVILLDLRVHNGFANVNNRAPLDDPLGEVYFDGLELEIPAGWELVQAFDDPIAGDPMVGTESTLVPLVAPRTDGTLHWMQQSGQFLRRLALCPSGSEARAAELLALEGRGMVVEQANALWSWSHPDTSRFQTQNFPLPDLQHVGLQAIRDAHAAELAALSQQLADADTSRGFPLIAGQLGWATPYDVPYGGATGGLGIELYPGVDVAQARSVEGLRLAQLVHRLQTDRQSSVLYRQDGNGTTELDWRAVLEDETTYVPINFYMGVLGPSDPMGVLSPPLNQVDYAVAQGLVPDYRDALAEYEPHDLQHLIRYTGPLKTLAWLCNDSLAIDDLLHQADLARLSYHPYLLSPAGAMSPTGMLADLEQALDFPGGGLQVGRGEGWAIDTRVAAFALGDEQRRVEERQVLLQFGQMLVAGQVPCTGHLMATDSPGVLGGAYRSAQSFETSILDHALRGVLESVVRGELPASEPGLEDCLSSHFAGFVGETAWSTTMGGPYNQYAVAPQGLGSVPYCSASEQPSDGTSRIVNGFQAWGTLAYAYRQTGDPIYLERAEELIGGPLLGSLLAEGLTNLGNRAPLLEVAQNLD